MSKTHLASVLFALVLSGCALWQRPHAAPPPLPLSFESPARRVVLVEGDVRLALLDDSDTLQPKFDWSASAQAYIASGISSRLSASRIELVHVGELTNSYLDSDFAPMSRASGACGPGAAFLWAEGARGDLRERYGADYALFVCLHDIYVTDTARIEQGFLGVATGGLMFLVEPPGTGRRILSAALVELKSGHLVWFNRLNDVRGDFRSAPEAQKLVAKLITTLPL